VGLGGPPSPDSATTAVFDPAADADVAVGDFSTLNQRVRDAQHTKRDAAAADAAQHAERDADAAVQRGGAGDGDDALLLQAAAVGEGGGVDDGAAGDSSSSAAATDGSSGGGGGSSSTGASDLAPGVDSEALMGAGGGPGGEGGPGVLSMLGGLVADIASKVCGY